MLPDVWTGLGFLRETLVIRIEERLQRQDPRVTFHPTTTRPADGNGEMDMWDALQIRTQVEHCCSYWESAAELTSVAVSRFYIIFRCAA